MNKYSLQIKHHSEIFSSRELAIEYINNKVRNNNLIGEPFLFLYGDSESYKPNAILVFGAGNGRISLIDIAETHEEIKKIENLNQGITEDIIETVKSLESVVNACGLSFDEENKKASYVANIDDDIIRKAQTISDAINLLSQYSQNKFKELQLHTVNSQTVSFNSDKSVNGVNIIANVNVSEYGSTDSTTINDNIICVKEDGLYASSDLLFDSEKRTLTFITSGIKNGVFQDDAKKKVFDLGEHTTITPKNDEHNVELKIEKVDSYNSTISADVKLSEDSNNILTKKDGKLLVNGVSSNIKHKDIDVETALNNNVIDIDNISKALSTEIGRAIEAEHEINNNIIELENITDSNKSQLITIESNLNTFKDEVDYKFNQQNVKLQEIIDNDIINGVETSTILMEATKGVADKGHLIKGNVLLSNDKSIIVSDGGLSANININVDVHNNKLYLNVGDKVIEQDLPGVNLIETIVYDQKVHTIVITFSNGKVATIPVDDLLEDYTFNNIAEEPITIETSNNTDGSVNVAARLKLRSNDNIISVENGQLYVSKEKIDNLVKTEEMRAIAAEENLTNVINKLAADVSTAIQNNTNLINAESERSKVKEIEIEGVINEHKNTTTIELNTLKDNVSTINSNITNINDKINNINVNIQNVVDGLSSESNRAEAVENQLYSNINNEIERAINEETSIKTTLNSNVESITTLNTKVDNIEKEINIINGTEQQKGSILQIVNHTKEDILNITKNYTDTVVTNKSNALQEQITTINATHYTKEEIDAKGFLTENQFWNLVSSLQQTVVTLTQQVETLQQEVIVLKNKPTDPDVAKALSALTGRDEEIFTNSQNDINNDEDPIVSLTVDMGEYGNDDTTKI